MFLITCAEKNVLPLQYLLNLIVCLMNAMASVCLPVWTMNIMKMAIVSVMKDTTELWENAKNVPCIPCSTTK